MKLYALVAAISALCVFVPWATQNLYLQTGFCEVQVWLWLTWGACLGWTAKVALTESSLGAPEAPMWLLALGAAGACAAFLLPPTLGAVPALGALYWAVAGAMAAERTALIAREAQVAARTGATWSLAADEIVL